jgi:predicted alpha/beta superfamily hydrolase
MKIGSNYVQASLVTLVALAFAAPCWAALPEGSSYANRTDEISIPNSRRVDFTSRVNGQRYSIMIAMPFVPPPPNGYGVLYVIDGNFFFGSAAEVVRNWNAPQVVVVAIGYPRELEYCQAVLRQRGPVTDSQKPMPACQIAPGMERLYDLTLPATGLELKAQTRAGAPVLKSLNVGGIDAYLEMIEKDVKPRVARLIHIDAQNQAIFGHSLGGLTALHALLTEPNAFRTFIIASPSIWWNGKAVLHDKTRFETLITSGQAHPRVLVTMGSEESTPPQEVPASWGITSSELAEELRKARMVANGSELVDWLKSLHGDPAYWVEDYAVFDGFTHGTSSWAALSRGVQFAFPGT